ncbi:MAG TPA: hypothetical protein PLI09_28115, partial [Candidatus Hydrogenedentes bacterium]|nr:hypothetical protein [Candidatus Hydrogenedentota bacterium]
MTIRFATGVWAYSSAADRFCPDGYRDVPKMQEVLSAISKIKGIKGIEIRQTDVTSEMPIKEYKRLLKEYNLLCSGVTANLA